MARTKVYDPVSVAALASLPEIRKSPDLPLSDQVYEEVLRLIVDAVVPVGNKLPTETEFCARFGVSRTVVREALSRLKIDGLIVSRPGQGSVVARRPKTDILGTDFTGSVADVQRFFEFRALIEREAAALAAQRRTTADLRRLRNAHIDLARSLSEDSISITPDLNFHEAVADAAHNHFLASSIMSLRDDFLRSMEFTRSLIREKREERTVLIIQEHGKILGAIERGDPQAASDSMAYHLTATRERIFMAEEVLPGV